MLCRFVKTIIISSFINFQAQCETLLMSKRAFNSLGVTRNLWLILLSKSLMFSKLAKPTLKNYEI
jgi:hypothetical protein